MSEPQRVPAAVRYKEITSLATSAAKRMREVEREKATELGELVASGRARTEEADRRYEWTVQEVESRWNAAMEALFEERWMRVTTMPEADSSAVPDNPETSVNAVQKAFYDLYQAVRAPRWSMRRKRTDSS
ncbi:hypothetical protein [Parasphingorhabdus pacifica]